MNLTKISYDQLQELYDSKSCNEVRDGCFAVVAGLHIERLQFFGAHGLGIKPRFTVCFYLASDCHVLTDGHVDFANREAFVGGFVFDTLDAANEQFNYHLTGRVCNPDHHDVVLCDQYDIRAYV